MVTFTEKQSAVCESKVTYLSEFTARNAGFLWRLVYRTAYRPYRCPCCGDWHLSSVKQ